MSTTTSRCRNYLSSLNGWHNNDSNNNNNNNTGNRISIALYSRKFRGVGTASHKGLSTSCRRRFWHATQDCVRWPHPRQKPVLSRIYCFRQCEIMGSTGWHTLINAFGLTHFPVLHFQPNSMRSAVETRFCCCCSCWRRCRAVMGRSQIENISHWNLKSFAIKI